jgi:hypothetical protein
MVHALKYPFVLAFLNKYEWLKGNHEGLLCLLRTHGFAQQAEDPLTPCCKN